MSFLDKTLGFVDDFNKYLSGYNSLFPGANVAEATVYLMVDDNIVPLTFALPLYGTEMDNSRNDLYRLGARLAVAKAINYPDVKSVKIIRLDLTAGVDIVDSDNGKRILDGLKLFAGKRDIEVDINVHEEKEMEEVYKMVFTTSSVNTTDVDTVVEVEYNGDKGDEMNTNDDTITYTLVEDSIEDNKEQDNVETVTKTVTDNNAVSSTYLYTTANGTVIVLPHVEVVNNNTVYMKSCHVDVSSEDAVNIINKLSKFYYFKG